MTAAREGSEAMKHQRLTLELEGITAGDYLTWLRDPDPPALGRELASVVVRCDPLGATVEALLSWSGAPPDAAVAGARAGLPITGEVVSIGCETLSLAPPPDVRVEATGGARGWPARAA